MINEMADMMERFADRAIPFLQKTAAIIAMAGGLFLIVLLIVQAAYNSSHQLPTAKREANLLMGNAVCPPVAADFLNVIQTAA
jgi:hypothetical protein